MRLFWLRSKAVSVWVLALLTETAVAAPWMLMLYSLTDQEDWPSSLPGFWVLVAAYGGGSLWEHGAPEPARRSGSGRVWAMGAGMVMIYLLAYRALPPGAGGREWLSPNPAQAIVPVAGYLWYKGAETAAQGLEYGRVYTRFSWQSLATILSVLLLVMSGAAGEPRIQVALYGSLFLLFGAGLTLLAVTRERALDKDQARIGEGGGAGEAVSPAVTGLVMGLVGLAAAAWQILSLERLHAFLAGVGRVIDRPFTWLAEIAVFLLVRLAMILAVLVDLVRRLLPVRPGHGSPAGMAPLQPIPVRPEEFLQRRLTDWAPYLKALWVLAALAVAATALYRLAKHRRPESDLDQDAEKVNLDFWAALLSDLSGLLTREGRPRPVPTDRRQEPVSLDQTDPRALFRRLQVWGRSMGRPRRTHETPSRYAQVLAERYPGLLEALVKVTRVYNQAQYASVPPPQDAVGEAAAAVSELERQHP